MNEYFSKTMDAVKRLLAIKFNIQKWVSLPSGLNREECSILYAIDILEDLKVKGITEGGPPCGLTTKEGREVLVKIKASGFKPNEMELKIAANYFISHSKTNQQ